MWTEGRAPGREPQPGAETAFPAERDPRTPPVGVRRGPQADGTMETAQHVMAASVTGTRREEPWDPAGGTAWTSRPRLWHGVPRASRPRTADAGSPVSEIEGRQGRFLPVTVLSGPPPHVCPLLAILAFLVL